MILLLAYTAFWRRSELTSLRVQNMTLCGDGQGLSFLRQLWTDQTREGVLFGAGYRDDICGEILD